MVVGLSYFEGGDETFKIEMLDALVACAAGYTVAAVMLRLFGIIKPGMSADEIVGKISLHAVPGSIGAILARRLLEVEETKKEKRRRAVVRRQNISDGRGSHLPGLSTRPDRGNGAHWTPDDRLARRRAGPRLSVHHAGLHLFS